MRSNLGWLLLWYLPSILFTAKEALGNIPGWFDCISGWGGAGQRPVQFSSQSAW